MAVLGSIGNLVRETFPPTSKFTEDDVPDLTGKVIIVTGGNSGIGKETTRVLMNHNAKVYIACRPSAKTTAAVEELRTVTGKPVSNLAILPLDLSDFDSIKAGVDGFLRDETRLDVLYNNGGIFQAPVELLTKHNLDLQFATNVLGHFYLTQLLLPLLISSATSSTDGKVRVVNVSGSGHHFSPKACDGGPIRLDTLVDGPARKKLDTLALFCQSKSGQVMFSNALARKYGARGIVSTSLNPGMIRSPLWRDKPQNWIQNKLSANVDLGAITQLYAGTSPEAASLNGKYLVPWARVSACRADHNDPEKEDEMWAWCEEQVGKYAPRG